MASVGRGAARLAVVLQRASTVAKSMDASVAHNHWAVPAAASTAFRHFCTGNGSPAGPPAAFIPLQRRSGAQPPARQEKMTTAVRPTLNSDWSEVVIKETNEVYYWNEKTGETTAVGEPRPGPLGRVQEPPEGPQRAGLGPQLG
eukprot:CAMPEP_0206149230 /NCGR_PEP_ID=MMETSP1473-20131121/37672_1 /ASSEMBLY_ACC=CAM_ASM_001109 /TAXON_ID=1461547 /ORGANISM="Stichococcus sp, Strain RCC1054" /LENGTH=143 /DNA_ID=CAMNT_0053546683 /DNA_START=420 /DNA_END=847 /DNA_ORIENTATION=+